jgi:hypothetical protein
MVSFIDDSVEFESKYRANGSDVRMQYLLRDELEHRSNTQKERPFLFHFALRLIAGKQCFNHVLRLG